MLRWAIVCLVLSIITGILGFGDVSAGLAGIAKVLFVLFLISFVLLMAGGLWLGGKISDVLKGGRKV